MQQGFFQVVQRREFALVEGFEALGFAFNCRKFLDYPGLHRNTWNRSNIQRSDTHSRFGDSPGDQTSLDKTGGLMMKYAFSLRRMSASSYKYGSIISGKPCAGTFTHVQDAGAWQREARAERPQPGREDSFPCGLPTATSAISTGSPG